DELTHFTEFQYRYLLSRIRGVNGYPKQAKSTGNPGGIGHDWVRRRFIDPRPPDTLGTDSTGRSLLFLPARLEDNPFLTRADPGYRRRLEALPERQRRALLEGSWELVEGRFFPEFERSAHVIDPFSIPAHWRRYVALDYGLDMLACYWAAFDPEGRGVIYRELYEPNLIVSQAAARILSSCPPDERIERFLAPPDLWGRSSDTGKSTAELFFEYGINLSRVSAAREAGWLCLREWLRPRENERGEAIAGLRILSGCVHLIRALGAIQVDDNNPNDCAVSPHELTHAPDAIRYLLAGRPAAPRPDEPDGSYDSCLGFGT
ncbi:MAG: terminase family protein, partial [Oscillospiraceae bacterium]